MAVLDGCDVAEAASDDQFAAFDAALTAATGISVDRSDDEVEASRLEAEFAFDVLVTALRRLPDGMIVDACTGYEQALTAERLLAVARMVGSSGNAAIDRRRARNAMFNGSGPERSRWAVNRDARRSAAFVANRHLAEAVSGGRLTLEAVDALVKASDDESGEIPVELVESVRGLAPDQAARVVTEHLEAVATATDVAVEYDRQREARRAYHYESPASGSRPALSGIALEGPEADIARVWGQVSAWADAAYQAEGGRDVPVKDHASLDNRRFDAVAGAVIGEPGVGNRGAGRPSVLITVDAESLFGDTDAPVVASQLGVGPIPEKLLAEYAVSGSIAAVLKRFDGSPLWFGRSRRRASDAQFLALAVRDRGCVLCRAGVDRCQAHHVMPWTAPGQGKTDVDGLALLCQRCHGDLHHRNHTLQCEAASVGRRIWSTRPATPSETPAAKPRHRKRE